MFLRIVLFLLSVISFLPVLSGQENTGHPIRYRSFRLTSCHLGIDAHTLIPGTVIVTHGKDTITDFKVSNRTLIFGESLCSRLQDSTLAVSYRTFGFDIEKRMFTIDSAQLTYKERPIISAYEYRFDTGKSGIVDASGLDYKGSFSRGFSVGNAQSLVLNSNFDMQLSGDLGNGLKVVAAITDENLPIQAQGNTQQLQEFDKIFIQVSKDRTTVTAGDYELRKPDSYFMNYFKKLKGVTLASTFNAGKDREAFAKGSFAISRGKFARQTIATREGNQGPYRLSGNFGERFIIVLAGTEKVYFNGILLTRGFDYDYIMDYNRAEIAFSPTRVIARDSRLIIEFEYTDINYLRTLYATQTEYSGKNWKSGLYFYSEQDSKNVTGDLQLDSTDISILEASGDDLTRSVRSGISLLGAGQAAESNRILYRGEPDPLDPASVILRFTTNPDSALYTAVFSEVGTGRGDYVIDETKNKNGRVYRYAGKNQGNYLPVVQLIPPEQKQLITWNATYKPDKNTDLYSEVALSNLDRNRRSPLDNGDNTGIATNIRIKKSISLDTSGTWKLEGHLNHEFLHKNFIALNQFRPPEFTRDWNVSMITARADENLLTTGVGLGNKKGFKADYQFSSYVKSGLYSGSRHLGTLDAQGKRLSARLTANVLSSSSQYNDQATTFLRPNATVSYKLVKDGKLTVGAIYDGESNVLRGITTDTMKRGSYAFDYIKAFVTSEINTAFSMSVGYSTRNDHFAKNGVLQHAALAREFEVAGKWVAGRNSDLSWSVTARDLSVLSEDLLPNDKSKKTVVGRLDYIMTAINQGIRSTTSYNTSSGQEPRIEYVFQKVETGRGDYFLINETENPNLSNIQDFRYDPSNPLASYIRLTLTNNEFIRTNNAEINQNLVIEPSKFKKPAEGQKFSGFYRFASRFSTLSNIKVSKKNMDSAASPWTSYLDFSLADSSLVVYNAAMANTLFLNRGNVGWDSQLGNRNNQSRIVQVSGLEDRGLNDFFWRTRVSLRNKADLFLTLEKSVKSYASEIIPTRNLDILIYRVKPEINYRPSQNTRLIARYTYQDKKQRILTKDVATVHELATEYTYRKATKFSLDATLSFVKIRFSGLPNSPIEYDMLESLKNGNNYLWNINYTRRIAKNIDLTFAYEGRKTGISPVVNVGRAFMKATF